MNDNLKLEELMKIPGLAEDLAEIRNADDLKEVFEKHSIQAEEGVTWEELFDALKKGAGDALNDELGEKELEQVAAGFAVSTTVIVIGGIIILGPPIAYGIGRFLGRRLARIGQ